MVMKSSNRLWRQLLSILVVAFVLFVGWRLVTGSVAPEQQFVGISKITEEVARGNVERVVVQGNKVVAFTKDGKILAGFKEADQGLKDYQITTDKVAIEVKNPDAGAIWTSVLSVLIPALIFVAVLYFFSRQARAGNSQALSFGKSAARPYQGNTQITFNDVAGLRNAKRELMEIVEFLKNPDKFRALGAEIPRGVLLMGSAGVGKTLLAKAVAGEAKVPFLSLSASEFVEMFVGVGASRVRDLFTKAKKIAPTVIFIDELDAVGRQRGTGLGGSHDEREQTLNQILVEMDGFETSTNVIVLAATNRPDVLDPALLRPGRFDRKVVLDLPDRKEREEILAVHTRNKPLGKDINLEEIAKATPGLSGADLRNIANEAAILAARDNRKQLRQQDLRFAIEKVMLGPERDSHLLRGKEREIVAYHEAGHAIVAHFSSELDELQKISLVSRGMALGYTLSLPIEDTRLIPQSRFEQEIAELLAGRAAEQLIFGEATTGSSNDLERATIIARNMVTVYGMSELGPVKFAERDELVFLGKEMSQHKITSEKIAALIDDQINKIIERNWQKANQIIKKNSLKLDQLAKELLEKEVLEREQILEILGPKTSTLKASR